MFPVRAVHRCVMASGAWGGTFIVPRRFRGSPPKYKSRSSSAVPFSSNRGLSMTRNSSSSSSSSTGGHGGDPSAAGPLLSRRPVALFLNCGRLDYDGKLDFSVLEGLTDFRRNGNVNSVVGGAERIVQLVKEANAEIVITKEMAVPAEAVLNFPPSVRLLCEAGTGYNNLPLDACHTKGVTVCNVPSYSTDAVAHTAITYVMNFSVSMLEQQRMLQNGDRSNFTGPFTLPLSELGGKTLGLVGGSGLIGSKVADIGLALGMRVIISSRKGVLPDGHRHAGHPRVRVTADVGDLLAGSDYVSLHTPLNETTRGRFGRAELEKMKPTAFLINTARGGLCNEAELAACLREGRIAGAGLDVTAEEPPSDDSALWTLPNVWLSPHIGWRRIETRQRLVDMTCANVRAYLQAASPDEYANVVT